MKIIGFVYNGEGREARGERREASGEWEMVLKCDSCLLNNRKPMFVPDWTNELGVTECLILRVSRLGKGIALKFADRYYDALAPGADFVAMDILREAQTQGKPWTRALDFDYSLAIGRWLLVDSRLSLVEPSEFSFQPSDWLMSPEEAIVEASKVMTIRQGDLIYIQRPCAPRPVQKEEIIRVEINGEEKLYCKVK